MRPSTSTGVEKPRCPWAGSDPLYILYHDEEWGVPLHDDQRLFEMLILEGAQAGLNWLTVLKKRQHYRRVFANFDVDQVARFGSEKIESLLQDPGIIRNRLKVTSAVDNARAFLKIREDCGSFDAFLWAFVGGKPIQNGWRDLAEVPVHTEESQQLSQALGQRGFRFVGPTICYALMQSVGMVNDHLVDCFRHAEVVTS